MARGIDIDQKSLDILVSAAADYAKLATAATITVNQGGFGGMGGLTSAQITTLAARYFAARQGENKDGVN